MPTIAPSRRPPRREETRSAVRAARGSPQRRTVRTQIAGSCRCARVRFRSCTGLRGRALLSKVFVLCIAHDLRQLGVASVIGHDYNRLQGSARRYIAGCVTAGLTLPGSVFCAAQSRWYAASPHRYRGRGSRPVSIRSNPADAEGFPRAPLPGINPRFATFNPCDQARGCRAVRDAVTGSSSCLGLSTRARSLW